ncbi:MAG: ankyrin repeat domain-containing protein, partial [bacterium]
ESRLLLVSGVSPDAVVFGGYTPLMLAVDCGKTEMVRLLLKNYANPNLSDIRGETALMRAERQGRMEIASLLRNYGATK